MPRHMVGAGLDFAYVDKRKVAKPASAGDSFTHESGPTIFTANAGGSTTTLVGANAAPGTNDVNTVRRGEKFRLVNAAGVAKEETVFKITGIAVAGSTTVTFTPAAAVATVSTDAAKQVNSDNLSDENSLDTFLLTVNGGASYPQARLETMTQNDKIYAVRLHSDADGL
jgi:hypothetical protein